MMFQCPAVGVGMFFMCTSITTGLFMATAFCKAGSSSFVRELIVPFGRTGYVVLFEIVDSTSVIIGAVRHQREDDYH